MDNWTKYQKLGLVAGILAIVGLVICVAIGYPLYNVWQKEQAGKSELKQAEWNRQIQVKEAEANLDSAKFDNQAEIERAKGLAAAIEIVEVQLGGSEQYLLYLWINGLHNEDTEVIYVPTEGNMPILEAGRLALGGE